MGCCYYQTFSTRVQIWTQVRTYVHFCWTWTQEDL